MPDPSPFVMEIWPDVPVNVRGAMDVPPTMASIPVPVVLAMAAAMPVNWKVGLSAIPSPLVTDRPKPLTASVREAKVDDPVLVRIPAPAAFKFAKAPVRLMFKDPCAPPSARLKPDPTVNERLLLSVGSLFTVKKLCVWTGDPASAAVVVCTDKPFCTTATTSVPVIGPAAGKSVK